jgi:hypothetical protein
MHTTNIEGQVSGNRYSIIYVYTEIHYCSFYVHLHFQNYTVFKRCYIVPWQSCDVNNHFGRNQEYKTGLVAKAILVLRFFLQKNALCTM